MGKRRVTLSLDEDVVEALKAVGGEGMSAFANKAIRNGIEDEARQAALLEWLDGLDGLDARRRDG